MALIQCPECKREISDQAVACPQCGYPIAAKVIVEEENVSNSGTSAETQDPLDYESDLGTPESTSRSSAGPLLIGGALLVLAMVFATDYGGLKSSLLKITGNATPTMKSEDMVRELFVQGSDLFDPHSVEFRNLEYTDSDILKDTVWCGEVNAKNRMGAYTGWNKFSASKTDEGEIEVNIYAGITHETVDLLYGLSCKGTYSAPAEIRLEGR